MYTVKIMIDNFIIIKIELKYDVSNKKINVIILNEKRKINHVYLLKIYDKIQYIII